MTIVSGLILFIVAVRLVELHNADNDGYNLFYGTIAECNNYNTYNIILRYGINVIFIIFGLSAALLNYNQHLFLLITEVIYILTILFKIIFFFGILAVKDTDIEKGMNLSKNKINYMRKYLLIKAFLSIILNGSIYIIISNILKTI